MSVAPRGGGGGGGDGRADELARLADHGWKRATEAARLAATHSARSIHIASQTETSRYVAAVVTEAARYVGEQTRRLAEYAREEEQEVVVITTTKWMTLSWYDRELVSDGEEPCEAENFPPAEVVVWRLDGKCALCAAVFGPALHRHHCRMCGRSVCKDHGWRRRTLPSQRKLSRVCEECDASLEGLSRAERCAWRVWRVTALVCDGGRRLKPFFEVPRDTTMHKARRCLRGVVAVARSCPLLAPASATVAVEVLEILCRYGPAGLATLVLRKEFVEAAEMLRRVATIDAAWPLSAHELTAAIYYLLALRRGERGARPDNEEQTLKNCDKASSQELEALRRLSVVALWCYLDSATAVQLVAAQQNWRFLFEKGFSPGHVSTQHSENAVAEPAFFCIASPHRKTAVLAIRGTASVHDVATDMRVAPVPFPPSAEEEWTRVDGTFAFAGMARAAQWVHEETGSAMVALASAGYDLFLTGHSLGAGVASLAAVLLREKLQEAGLFDAARRMKCYGFATPACVDKALAEKCREFVVSVVLHDDVVPRLTARSLRCLMTELLRQRETCMQHWRDDLDAVWTRLRHGLWAPRFRDASLLKGSLLKGKDLLKLKQQQPSEEEEEEEDDEDEEQEEEEEVEPLEEASDGEAAAAAMSALALLEDLAAREAREAREQARAHKRALRLLRFSDRQRKRTRKLALTAARTAGVSLDDDEAASTSEEEVSDSSSASSASSVFEDCRASEKEHESEAQESEEEQESAPPSSSASSSEEEQEEASETSRNDAHDDVEDDFRDVELPELYIPGRVVLIYSCRGLYEAALVQRDCSSLTEIAVSANMIADHSIAQYMDALAEVLMVREAPQRPPAWQPFHATDACECCKAAFTWHTTSRTEPQTYREKHNCRECGLLVCDPCSKRRKPLPAIGLLAPSRVCDRCYFSHDSPGGHPRRTITTNDESDLVEENFPA